MGLYELNELLDEAEQARQALEGLAPHDHRLAHGERLEALEIGGQVPGQLAFMADRTVRGAGVDQDNFVVHGVSWLTRVT